MTAASTDLDRVAWGRLVALLAPRLGHRKGAEVLAEAAQKLGLPSDRMEYAQALALLDEVGRQEGLVGVVASFAKSRLMLRAGS